MMRTRILVSLAAVFCLAAAGLAQDRQPDRGSEDPMRPTEIGVRFTPEMSHIISMKLSEQMARRYELDGEQSRKVQEVMSRRLLSAVRENARPGRDFIETMMTRMIEHNGRLSLPKEQAVEFARLMNPLFPVLKEFISETSGEISKIMTTRQRLKYMADVAGASLAVTLFESRMKRWEEGDVPDRANPFRLGRSERNRDEDAEPEDPNESRQHRQARDQSEPQVEQALSPDRAWEEYVKRATEYYQFREPQIESTRAILKESRDRLETLRTPALRSAMLDNLIARQLTWRTRSLFSQGPWMFKLEADYERMLKPIRDLERDLKRRIDALPDARQRAEAEKSVRKALADRGMDRPPT